MASEFLPMDTPSAMSNFNIRDQSTSNEFNAFCDFLVSIQKQGAENITPEQSVQEFRNHQAQLQQWQEKNRLSQQQAQRDEAKPIDDEAVLARLRSRLAQSEKSE